jgi:hypothetical protein
VIVLDDELEREVPAEVGGHQFAEELFLLSADDEHDAAKEAAEKGICEQRNTAGAKARIIRMSDLRPG